MCVNERRHLIVPPHLGYGSIGVGKGDGWGQTRQARIMGGGHGELGPTRQVLGKDGGVAGTLNSEHERCLGRVCRERWALCMHRAAFQGGCGVNARFLCKENPTAAFGAPQKAQQLPSTRHKWLRGGSQQGLSSELHRAGRIPIHQHPAQGQQALGDKSPPLSCSVEDAASALRLSVCTQQGIHPCLSLP